MAKRKIKIIGTYTYDVDFEIDEDNPKLKELMDDFRKTIFNAERPEELCAHIVHNQCHLGASFTEGIGTEEEAEACGLNIINYTLDSDYDEKEID